MKTITPILLLLLIASCSLVKAEEIKNSTYYKDKVCNRYKDEADKSDEYFKQSQINSNEEIKDAKQFIEDHVKGKTYLRDRIIDESITDEEFATELVKDIGPWAVLFILSLLGYITYVFCYIYDLCCKKLVCCRKKDGNYSKCELVWPVIGIKVFCLWVIIASGFGLYRASTFSEGYFLMKCQIYSFFDDFIVEADYKGNKWIGLTGLDKEMEKVENEFVTEVNKTFNEAEWIESGYTEQTTAENTLRTDSIDKYDYSTAPTYTSDTYTESKYFNGRFGAFTTAWQTFVEEPLLELKDSLLETQQVGLSLKDDSFQKGIQDGRKEIQSFQKEMDDFIADFEKDTEDIDNDYMDLVNTIITYYFALSIAIAIISILTTSLVAFLKFYKLRFFMHISWCGFSIMMILGFLLCTLLYGISVLGIQGCQIMDNILVDYNELEKVTKMDQDLLSKIKTCKEEYGGTGLILKDLGLDQDLNQVKDLTTNLKVADEKKAINDEKFAELNDKNTKELTNLNLVENYGYSQNPDNESEKIFEYTFNTNYQNVCNPGDFSMEDCTGSQIYTMKQFFRDEITDLNSHCSNVHTYKDSSTQPTDYQTTPTCVLGDSDFGTLLGWVEKKNEIVGLKKTQLQDLNTKNQDYGSKISGWFTAIGEFRGVVDGILDKVVNIIEKETNCLFIGNNISKVHEALCVETIPNVFWISIIFIIHSIGMFCGAFFLYCAGFRYANVKSSDEKYKDDENGYKRTQAPGEYQ